jgi:ribosomal protein L27
MSHVKAGGSSKNNHDSPGQRLGVKLFGGEKVTTGQVIVRQVGLTKRAGVGTKLSRNYTIHADRDGIVTYKLAAHAGDLAKGHPGAQYRDNALSKARFEFRWRDQFNQSLDPDRALEYFNEGRHTDGEYCTMCGPNFCAAKLTHDLRKFKK